MSSPAKSLAIIGGGASMGFFLAHLARVKDAQPRTIRVFDRSGVFGTGIAYGTKDPNHLLNTRVKDMSGLADDPHHFSGWAGGHREGYGVDDFVPRAFYGEYLKDLLDEAATRLRGAGYDLEFIPEEVRAVKPGFKIETPEKTYDAANVLLATGNAIATRPAGADVLSAKDGYYAEPWSADYKNIKGPVVILGTGLSMVDAVLSLHAAGYAGGITAISRRGLLPTAHTRPLVEYKPFLSKNEYPDKAMGALKILRAEVKNAAAKNIPWQAVIDSLRRHTNPIWQNWPKTEQDLFLRRLFAFWSIHRHRMPPQAAAIIEEARTSGQLVIEKDSIERVTPGLVTGRRKTWEAGAVINCLGYRWDKDAGFACSHRIGPPRWGELLETTALQEIRAQAAELAIALGSAT